VAKSTDDPESHLALAGEPDCQADHRRTFVLGPDPMATERFGNGTYHERS